MSSTSKPFVVAGVAALAATTLVLSARAGEGQSLDPSFAASLREGGGVYVAPGSRTVTALLDFDGGPEWPPHLCPSLPAVLPPVQYVMLGNQRPLNGSRIAYAMYLVAMHNRFHPRFADVELPAINRKPGDAGVGQPSGFVKLDLVIEPSGALSDVRVIASYDVAPHELEAAALRAVRSAEPFAPPPAEIRSADCRVHVLWEFHRDPAIACSTQNAYPYLLSLSAGDASTGPGDAQP